MVHRWRFREIPFLYYVIASSSDTKLEMDGHLIDVCLDCRCVLCCVLTMVLVYRVHTMLLLQHVQEKTWFPVLFLVFFFPLLILNQSFSLDLFKGIHLHENITI